MRAPLAARPGALSGRDAPSRWLLRLGVAVGRGALADWLPDAEIGRALVHGEFFCDARLQDGGHANAWDWWDPPAGVHVGEDSPESERQAYAVHWARADLAHRYAGP